MRSIHQRCSVRKGVLEILQNSQENTCARFSFLIKLQASSLRLQTLTQMFSCEFCEISKNTFFTEHFWATASNFFFVANHIVSKTDSHKLKERFWKHQEIKREVLSLFKGALSALRQCLATERPIKIMTNVFYFSLKALFVVKIP